MRRGGCLIAFVIVPAMLLFVVGASEAQFSTVSGSTAGLCQFAFYHYQEDANAFRHAVADQGIELPPDNQLVISDPYTTPEPPTGSPTVQSFLALVERSPDVLLISSHGDDSGNYLLVEGYSSAELRNERLQDLEEQYSGWLDSFSIVDDPDYEVDVWGIAVHRGLCTYDFDNDRAIVFAGFCHGGDWLDAWGAGAAVGYTGSEFTWHSAIDTFFVRLNGERGREKRCTGEALPDSFELAGSPDIVLSPAVEEMYPPHHTGLDGEFTGGSVQFDTALMPEGRWSP